MNLEFNLIKQPLEKVLAQKGSTHLILLFLLFTIILTILLTLFNFEPAFIAVIIAFFLITTTIIKMTANTKTELEIINENLDGKLIITQNPFQISTNTGENIVDENFKGFVTLKYEGFYHEVQGNSKYPNVYFGTNNKITFHDAGNEKTFYIYLYGSGDKKKFDKIANILNSNNIDTKEYTKGVRTYYGQELSYTEIQELKKNRNI
ncbi:MAG TPA: hypothetical protein PKD51_08870 [Saprospiraceae bacterium]|nr:hypothetical protein [Saprospiraceae bacterium]